jgi:hypothetical protein
MSLQDLIDEAKELAESLCEDTCSIIDVEAVTDEFGGQTPSTVTVASEIPCLVEAQRDMPGTVIAGAVGSITRTTIFLKSTAETQLITPDYEIVVDARGDKPERTYVDPRILDNSYEVLLTISAKLRQ